MERRLPEAITSGCLKSLEIEPEALAATGTGDFWPLPLHEVKDGDDES